jgi:hyperosmotically inducible periplasmic protein
MSKIGPVLVIAGLLQCAVPVAYAQKSDSSADRQTQAAPDNTRANKADRGNAQPTAQDQPNAKSDRDLAAAVRKAITQDKSLSTYAHNVNVVVRDGAVTLRGPVRSGDEKTKVAELARQTAGSEKIDDQMSIKKTTKSKTSQTERTNP